MAKLKSRFLGKKISYQTGMTVMRESINRVRENCAPKEGELLFLEHTDTITLTRQYGQKHLLVSQQVLKKKNINLVETDRGGDITFHGQGQLVGYPIIKLPQITDSNNKYLVDLGLYVRKLEHALVESCKKLGVLSAKTISGYTGVWIESNNKPQKLVAIGVGVSKGVTRHGFALNINTDLQNFLDCIVPCGLQQMGITSLANIYINTNQNFCWDNICDIIAQELEKTVAKFP